MPLSFDRVQAGEYQISDGPKMVGYIRKLNSSKWAMYKGTNPSLLGTPISVKKTLKLLKEEAVNLIESTYVKPAKKSVDINSLIQDASTMDQQKYKLMQEMLERNYVINLNEYRHTEKGLERVSGGLSGTPDEMEVFAP